MIKKSILFFLLVSFIPNIIIAQKRDSLKLFFESNSDVISSIEHDKLEKFIENINPIFISEVSIVAYCDDKGSSKYNQILSDKRANSVKESILNLKIKNELITKFVGKGELPITKKDTIQERAFNRRVEVNIKYEIVEVEAVEEMKETKNIFQDLKAGDKITLNNILFIGGMHRLLPESYGTLDSLTNTLKNNKGYHILILGHVCCRDPSGGDGLDNETGVYNLSTARAKEIYDYLISQGINKNRLDYKGMKADYPTGKGDKYDRRVEIQITSIIND